jgi:signal peptidase I
MTRPLPTTARGLIGAVIFAAFGVTGCSYVHEKMDQAKAIASIARAGHSYRAYSIPSDAMTPALKQNSVVIGDESAYQDAKPMRGDIVIFKPPIPSQGPFIKRVVGLPGTTFEMIGGKVNAGGSILTEAYIPKGASYEMAVRNYGIYESYGSGWRRLDPTSANIPPKSMWTSPDTIPSHCYIVLGDNRNDSEDSHIWGFAQDSGNFATGPEAGQATGTFSKVVKVLPSE